ncbi:MAG: 7TM diverse intracellular signaling domain-containing protein, partial [Leptospirales bacterium]
MLTRPLKAEPAEIAPVAEPGHVPTFNAIPPAFPADRSKTPFLFIASGAKYSRYAIGRMVSTAILLGAILSSTSCAENDSGEFAPLAKQGTLDLRDWNFEGDGPVALRGEWEYYWNQLLGPEEIAADARPNYASRSQDFASVPSIWPATNGFATYRLRILLPNQRPHLMASIREQGSAYKLYWNGLPLARNGRVATSPQRATPQFVPMVRDLPRANDEASIEVVMQISNYDANTGGFYKPAIIGTSRQIVNEHSRRRNLEIFLVGALLIMGLYHFAIWWYRPKESAAFWLGWFCLAISTRLLTTGERLLQSALPDLPWVLFYKIEFLGFYGGVTAFALFLQRLFPRAYAEKALRLKLALSLPMCAAVVFLPARLFVMTLAPMQLLTLAACSWALYVLVRAVIQGETGARVILGGFVIIFAAIVNDILHANYLLGYGYLSPIGFFFFIFAQAAAYSRRIATAFNTSEELSANLEDKVQRRTRDLQEARTVAESSRIEIEQLNEFSKRINATRDLDEIIDGIFQHIDRSFGCDGIILMLPDRRTNELYAARQLATTASRKVLNYFESARVPLLEGGGMIAKTWRRGRPFYMSDTQDRDIFRRDYPGIDKDREFIRGLELKSFLLVPMIVRDETVA